MIYCIKGLSEEGETREIMWGMETLEEAEEALESMSMYGYVKTWIEPIDIEEEHDPFRSDAEADADALVSLGWGTDEDYGYFGDDY